MTASKLLQELRDLGVELVAAGDCLRFRPAGSVGPELREALRSHKAELLRLFGPEPQPPYPDPDPPVGERKSLRRGGVPLVPTGDRLYHFGFTGGQSGRRGLREPNLRRSRSYSMKIRAFDQ